MLALKRAEIERVVEKKLRVAEVVAELKKLHMWQQELDRPTDAIGIHAEEEPEKVRVRVRVRVGLGLGLGLRLRLRLGMHAEEEPEKVGLGLG